MGRSLPILLVTLLLSLTGLVQAQSAARSPCPHAIKIDTNYQYRGTLHFICLQAQPNLRPRLDVIEYLSQTRLFSREVDELDTNQLASFVDDEGSLRILLAVPHRVNGTSMYSFDNQGRFIEETHTINTQFVSAMSIWKLALSMDWHLAIANQPDYSPLIRGRANGHAALPDPKPMISIHSWRSTYFDSYQVIALHPDSVVNKIEPMYINGQEFLVVATESNGNDNGFTSSGVAPSIYRLNFGDGNLNWALYQSLDARMAIDVRSFAVTHRNSLQQDYYIAILGQLQPFNGGANSYQAANETGELLEDEHSLIIYKYFGDKFERIDFLSAFGANKMDTISYGTGDSYVIIALLSQYNNQINLYLFDGLDLQPIKSPYNSISRLPSPIRRRRIIAPPVVRLFHAPQSNSMAGLNETAAKRTLGDESNPVLMPALALASFPQTSADIKDGDNVNQPSGSLFQIPVENMIKDEQNQTNYNKRNLVADDSLLWCKSTIQSLMRDSFESTSKQVLSLPKINQQRPIELKGDLFIDNDLYVSNLLYVTNVLERVDLRRGALNYSQLYVESADYSNTFFGIQQVHSEIDELTIEVDQILVDDGTEQDIFRPISFDTLIVECLNPGQMDPRFQLRPFGGIVCPQIDELETNLLNKRPVSDIQKKAYLTGRSSTIERDVRFEHLVLKGRVDIMGTLNGLSIGDIVFKVGPSIAPIKGTKNFINGMLSSSNLVVDRWNSRTVDRRTVLVSTGEQRVESDLRFDQVIIDSNQMIPNVSSRIEKLNEVHLDTHLGQIALTNHDNNFEVPLHFDELVLNGQVRFTQNSRLSSVDLADLWANAMFKQAIQNVSAPMVFQTEVYVSYGGDIIVDGPVNNVVFQPDSFVMRDSNATIRNPVIFDDVTIQNAYIRPNNTLNGIQVLMNPTTSRYELAILYNHGDQLITADKALDDVRLGGSSTITGLINGHLNLNQLYDLTTNNRPFKFSHIRLGGANFRVADTAQFHVDSTINGFRADDLCSLANRVSDYPQTVYNRLKFNQPIRFKTLRCGAINGYNNLSNYFLTRHGNQHVAGTLRLLNGAIFNISINIQSTFNNLNIAPLSRSIFQANNENRTGHKEVYGDLVIENLFAEQINNLRLSNVFLSRADNPQIVRAPMSFDHLDIESILTVGHDLLTSSFNGLNITDLVTNTLQYDTPQVIYNHVELNTLQLLPGSNFITPNLNGHNLRRLYNDAVLVDVPQQIMAPKTFRNLVEFTDKVYLRYGLDGLTDEELRFNLLLQSDELIEGDLEFNNDIFVRKELEIQSGIINDIDVNLFVSTMLYENRPDQKGLRISGNGSITFKDVDVQNLVVGGKIQGIDLSKDAIMKSDNVDGTYLPQLVDRQNMLNNLRLLNAGYGPGTTFWVRTKYAGEPLMGECRVQYCPRTTVQPPITGPKYQPYVTHQTPAPSVAQILNLLPIPLQQQTLIQRPLVMGQIFNHSIGVAPQQSPLQSTRPMIINQERPVKYVQQFYPSVLPRPISFINNTLIETTWTPNWNVIHHPTSAVNQHANYTHIVNIDKQVLFEPQYIDHVSILQAQAIRELTLRINKYLSITFYYEIKQKHPLLGPLLHAPRNPIANEEGSALLLLKGTGRPGEPCLQVGQTVAIMAQQRIRNPISTFTQSSLIQGTSNPTIIASVVANTNHYLFVLDTYPTGSLKMMSRVMVYFWNTAMGLYELREEIEVDGFPIAMKAFVVNSVACVALANPRVLYGNSSGAPLLYCQHSATSTFDLKIVLPIENVFDLDILTQPRSSKIVIAALAQQVTEQIGDLMVNEYDIASGRLEPIALRRMAKPLKLHFIHSTGSRGSNVQLVVSEAITSNDDTQAITRIFTLRNPPGSLERYGPSNKILFYESQLFRDNQFYDIQSVLLSENRHLLFLQSAHSISIYAPLNTDDRNDCDAHYSLAQKIPTKGANKFLVFNDSLGRNRTNIGGPYSHFLVLSKDDCEQQQYSTLILRSKFK